MIKPKGGTRIMKISAIRSDKVYSKIMNAPLDKKNDIYRYELMKPFEKKWACYSVPMKALTPNGYDVITLIVKVVVSKNLYSCFDRLSDIVLYLT